MLDGYQRPPLRYRRFGGGYRREDVEFTLAELHLTMRQLDVDLQSLRERNRDLEAELTSARGEVEAATARELEMSRSMAAALRRAAEVEEGAHGRAQEIVAQAKEVAARIRAEASRRIEMTSTQFNELLRLKDNLLDAMRGVVADFDHAISRVEQGEQLFSGTTVPGAAEEVSVEEVSKIGMPEPPPSALTVPEPTPAIPEPAAAIVEPPVSPVEEALRAPEPVVATPAEQFFETHVELDAGPFSDFVALSAFERSLSHLAKVEDVYVRRLAEDRALIELTMSEPAPLLETMREFLPYSLEVRFANRSRVVLDVFAQSPVGAIGSASGSLS